MTDETKIALERYRNIIGYFQYENTIFWTRSSFIMVTQAAMIGFSFRLFPVNSSPSWVQIFIIFMVAGIGLALCEIWKTMNAASQYWLNRWKSLLLTLEADAYGDIRVFRDAQGVSLRKSSDSVRLIFTFTWVVFILYGCVWTTWLALICRPA